MQQITYAMRFQGKAIPVNESPLTLKASLHGSGCKMITEIPDTDGRAFQAFSGSPATFESEVTFTGDTTFKESGSITFGSAGNRLLFSTVGAGYLGLSSDPRLKHGSVMWRIEGGEGQFEGASGLITSNSSLGNRARSPTTI
jgi:hypothetical protein